MRISVLCSDEKHPINAYLLEWIEQRSANHSIELVRRKDKLSGGDILFLISCSELITKAERNKYKASLVIHASDLPKGRGWSPHIWQILEGNEDITVSLLEAEDKVDSGRIWKKVSFKVSSNALWDEINESLFKVEIELMEFAIREFSTVEPQEQSKQFAATYYPKRTPADSQVDPNRTIAEQFDCIRVCDPNRFPAFFKLRGRKYIIKLEKVDE
ncbi:formyltransferase family protein [Kangiella geojedonensis]|uniref:UDP-glucuronic acid dehydrogenase n=1 Tax=Kangiella geojedonensis TaxID=914150 RepID=A0A0F6TRL6_9GAMM|nr:formyltransferase family protein [Kangiella geojedonensis]AKE52350.1 UDP-glucuronic acid dehydrogenase [Kangiella geojedonensis]